MYVIEKMRLNRFQSKPIVSNRALFHAKGDCSATITSKDTTECYDSPSIVGASKTKLLGLANEVAVKAYQHHKGQETDELNKSQRDL